MRNVSEEAAAIARADRDVRTLQQHDVGFSQYDAEGRRLLVRGRIDYYPGTGRWYDRATLEEGEGVWTLLSHLGVSTPAKEG